MSCRQAAGKLLAAFLGAAPTNLLLSLPRPPVLRRQHGRGEKREICRGSGQGSLRNSKVSRNPPPRNPSFFFTFPSLPAFFAILAISIFPTSNQDFRSRCYSRAHGAFPPPNRRCRFPPHRPPSCLISHLNYISKRPIKTYCIYTVCEVYFWLSPHIGKSDNSISAT